MTFGTSSKEASSICQRRRGLKFFNVTLEPLSPVKYVRINLAHLYRNGKQNAGAFLSHITPIHLEIHL